MNFAPYENPSKNIARRQLKPEVKENEAKPTVHEKMKSKQSSHHEKTPKENPDPVSNKLFTGVAVWGPGGYTKGRGRSGSADSSGKSDSSSTSSGSERQPIKTRVEVRTDVLLGATCHVFISPFS